jgi:GntR family transcriptional regulator, rspAB operon transcriptional repressor
LLDRREHNLVEVRARSGYRVRPISIAEAREMYEIRDLYEKACVTRAVDHATDQQIEDLEEHLTSDVHMDAPEWIALNRRFHSALAVISGNSCMAEAANRLNDQFDRFTLVSVGRLQQPIDWTRFNNEHSAIVTALRARDKRTAVTIIRAHIEASRLRTILALTNAAVVP